MQIDPKLSCTLYSELGVHFVRNTQKKEIILVNIRSARRKPIKYFYLHGGKTGWID